MICCGVTLKALYLWRFIINLEGVKGYGQNNRGLGCVFGADVVEKFNRNNKLEMIIRSHQLVMDGYK